MIGGEAERIEILCDRDDSWKLVVVLVYWSGKTGLNETAGDGNRMVWLKMKSPG